VSSYSVSSYSVNSYSGSVAGTTITFTGYSCSRAVR
jgi:hypothetical protein